MRSSFSDLAEAPGRFMAANLVWVLVASVPAMAGAAYNPAYGIGLLLIPFTCGLTRMACYAARDRAVSLRQFREGIRYRVWRHLALGAGQSAVLVMAVVNVGTGLAGTGVLPALVAIVAGNVAVLTFLLALAAWPILLDPRRTDIGIAGALRLALAVVAAHPLVLLVIALIEGVLVVATMQTIVLGLFLPAFGILLAVHHVLPVADRLQERR